MVTDAVPDEPLGSHVLELEVADVVVETEDARSLVFQVPGGPEGPADTCGAVALCARTIPDAAGPQRPHRVGGALLLPVQLALH